MIRSALLVGFLANVAIAASNIREGEGSIALKSQAAEKLLKSARRLNGQQEEENTWMTKFDLKFHSCYSMTQVGDREGGGGGNEEDNNLYMQHIVKLQLCPSDQCVSGRGCSGGAEYLVNMAEYVQSYVEFKEEQKQQACENVRENCYCNDNQDDQACENQCYAEKGLDYCIENENNGNNNNQEFNIDEYMECREMENQNNNNNNNYNQYFIGPCKYGTHISHSYQHYMLGFIGLHAQTVFLLFQTLTLTLFEMQTVPAMERIFTLECSMMLVV